MGLGRELRRGLFRSSSASGSEAFRGTAAGGMVGLGDLAGGGFTGLDSSVNAEGSVVV